LSIIGRYKHATGQAFEDAIQMSAYPPVLFRCAGNFAVAGGELLFQARDLST
jgi:hypothetical protein